MCVWWWCMDVNRMKIMTVVPVPINVIIYMSVILCV